MLPFNTTQQTQCLERLVGIRSSPEAQDFSNVPFFIEDIEGVDIQRLAAMTKGSNPSGKDFAQQLINSAAREMLGNVELFLNNGYSLKNLVGDMCSTCQLLPTYSPNSGITITSNVLSDYQLLKVSRLTILINQTGSFQFVIDDGANPKTYSANFVSGILCPVNLDYTTDQKKVNIYFVDNTIGLGQVYCTSNSSCGCGGSGTSNSPVTVSGYLNGADNTIGFGFIPCSGIACSFASLLCNMVQKTPNIFGLALLYKVGEKYFLHRNASGRNNDSVSFNEGSEDEVTRNYSQLYWATMQGARDRKGIKHIINDYLRGRTADRCISCDSLIKTGHVTG